MPENRPKRPHDPAQLAKLMIDIASGEVEDRKPTAKQVRAHKAGSKGGPARAKALTPEHRSNGCRHSLEEGRLSRLLNPLRRCGPRRRWPRT